LIIEGQPAHIQARHGKDLDSDGRDRSRAIAVREALAGLPDITEPTA